MVQNGKSGEFFNWIRSCFKETKTTEDIVGFAPNVWYNQKTIRKKQRLAQLAEGLLEWKELIYYGIEKTVRAYGRRLQ